VPDARAGGREFKHHIDADFGGVGTIAGEHIYGGRVVMISDAAGVARLADRLA
jgi:hypothetical protein